MVFGRPIVLLLSCASTDADEERECVSYCELKSNMNPLMRSKESVLDE